MKLPGPRSAGTGVSSGFEAEGALRDLNPLRLRLLVFDGLPSLTVNGWRKGE